MAPTIYEDDMEAGSHHNSHRILRHRSVINYVGHQSSQENETNDELESNEKESQGRRGREFIPYSSERRNTIKRIRRETRMSYDSDDSSSNSIPSPMSFHNYAKRQKFNDSEDDDEKYISTSSDSNENSVSSTISFNNDVSREGLRLHSLNYLLKPTALAPFSPVSSTTGAMTVYCKSKASPRYINPFYRQDLMEIAMKTIILLQKNRSLHARLHQLKLETRAFVNTVMSNPENAKLRQTMNQSNEKLHDHQALAVKNQ